jgi:hypothetical protein
MKFTNNTFEMANTKFYNRHLVENDMNYFEHMWFALKLCVSTFGCAVASLIHAFFPFVLVTHTSRTIKKLNEKFVVRGRTKTEAVNEIYTSSIRNNVSHSIKSKKHEVNTINYQ